MFIMAVRLMFCCEFYELLLFVLFVRQKMNGRVECNVCL